MKAAFIGFRHGHIVGLYNRLKDDPQCEIVAACEEDPKAAAEAKENWGVDITHSSFSDLLADTDFDILAIGDYFGIRGSRAIAGLKAGKHVIADKPLCTSPEELAEIRSLASEKKLAVGLMLDFRQPTATSRRQKKSSTAAGSARFMQSSSAVSIRFPTGRAPHGISKTASRAARSTTSRFTALMPLNT